MPRRTKLESLRAKLSSRLEAMPDHTQAARDARISTMAMIELIDAILEA